MLGAVVAYWNLPGGTEETHWTSVRITRMQADILRLRLRIWNRNAVDLDKHERKMLQK
jgi:hypothetical protein